MANWHRLEMLKFARIRFKAFYRILLLILFPITWFKRMRFTILRIVSFVNLIELSLLFCLTLVLCRTRTMGLIIAAFTQSSTPRSIRELFWCWTSLRGWLRRRWLSPIVLCGFRRVVIADLIALMDTEHRQISPGCPGRQLLLDSFGLPPCQLLLFLLPFAISATVIRGVWLPPRPTSFHYSLLFFFYFPLLPSFLVLSIYIFCSLLMQCHGQILVLRYIFVIFNYISDIFLNNNDLVYHFVKISYQL